MAELEKTNEALSTENSSLTDKLRATMDQLALLKEQVELMESQKSSDVERVSNEFLLQIKQQQESITQLQSELEQANPKSPQFTSGNIMSLQKDPSFIFLELSHLLSCSKKPLNMFRELFLFSRKRNC